MKKAKFEPGEIAWAVEHYGSWSKAAAALGIGHSSVARGMRRYKNEGGEQKAVDGGPGVDPGEAVSRSAGQEGGVLAAKDRGMGSAMRQRATLIAVDEMVKKLDDAEKLRKYLDDMPPGRVAADEDVRIELRVGVGKWRRIVSLAEFQPNKFYTQGNDLVARGAYWGRPEDVEKLKEMEELIR